MTPRETYKLMQLVEQKIKDEKEPIDGELHVLHDQLLYEFMFVQRKDDRRWFKHH